MKTLLAILAITLPIAPPVRAGTIADAAQNRDKAAVTTLLRQKANVNAAQPDGTTALHWAAHWNDLESVNLLLKAGANAKAANRYGISPLSEAAGTGNAAMIEALLKAGADPKIPITPDGETVLMAAARTGNLEAVKSLLAHGADVNAKESYRGQTALMWAAAEHHSAIVKLLLEKGADWKIQSLARDTKMPKLSAASSVTPMARGGFTALHFVAREGDIATTQVMLDAGVDINQGDADNTSALVVALLNKRYTYAKFLLDKGANPNLADVKGRAALYAAIDIRNEDYSATPSRKEDDALPSIEIVKAILAKNADVNAKLTKNLPGRSGMDSGDTTLDQGTTPLMRAARAGDHVVMRLLVDKGADPKPVTQDGNNALMFAAGVGYRDKNTRGSESDQLEAVKLALAQGIDLHAINTKGEMAIHGAAFRGADSIVQFLVEKGAKLDAMNKQGNTPLDVALGKGAFQLPVPRDSTVALLRKLGAPESKDLKQVAKAE